MNKIVHVGANKTHYRTLYHTEKSVLNSFDPECVYFFQIISSQPCNNKYGAVAAIIAF